MSSTIKRHWKRRCVQVSIPDDDPAYIRPLTIRELMVFENLPDQSKTGYIFGRSLCDSSAVPLIEQEDGESDADFAKRALELFCDMPSDTASMISDAIEKAMKSPSVEKLEKN